MVSGVLLDNPRMLVLGDFNKQPKIALNRLAWYIMTNMGMGLSQNIVGSLYEAGHTLDFFFFNWTAG